MAIDIKGWAAAQRYNGGIVKYLYDVVKELASGNVSGYDDTALKERVETLEGKVEALENAS